MTENAREAWVASVLGLATLIASLIFGILIPFIVWGTWLAITEPPTGYPIGEGMVILFFVAFGLLAGFCLGIGGWHVLWEERASSVRWQVHRALARTMAVCTAIVLAGCAKALGVRSEIRAPYRILLVLGIVGMGYGTAVAAFRWNREQSANIPLTTAVIPAEPASLES